MRKLCILWLLACFVHVKTNYDRYDRYGYETAASLQNSQDDDFVESVVNKIYHYDNQTKCQMACEERCEMSQVIYNDEQERMLFTCRRRKPFRGSLSLLNSSRKALLTVAFLIFCAFLLVICCCCSTCFCCNQTRTTQFESVVTSPSPPGSNSLRNGFKEKLIPVTPAKIRGGTDCYDLKQLRPMIISESVHL